MVDVQILPAIDSRPLGDAEEEEAEEAEERRLRELEEVAAQFVYLVLEDQPGAQPLGGKSPVGRLAPGAGGQAAPSSNAPEIARKLKGIGDNLDAKVEKEIREATAELFRHRSVFQVGAAQFNRVCSRVLSRCSAVVATGWQQMSVVYLTLSQMSRQVEPGQPQGQPADVVAGRLYRFTRDYVTDVGLDTWIHEHGGLATVLEHNTDENDLSQPDVVSISETEL